MDQVAHRTVITASVMLEVWGIALSGGDASALAGISGYVAMMGRGTGIHGSALRERTGVST